MDREDTALLPAEVPVGSFIFDEGADVWVEVAR
jgi:hypothetical protein